MDIKNEDKYAPQIARAKARQAAARSRSADPELTKFSEAPDAFDFTARAQELGRWIEANKSLGQGAELQPQLKDAAQ